MLSHDRLHVIADGIMARQEWVRAERLMANSQMHTRRDATNGGMDFSSSISLLSSKISMPPIKCWDTISRYGEIHGERQQERSKEEGSPWITIHSS